MAKKIVFMGTPEFSVPILEGLIADEQYEVIAVVTQPDRPVGRKKILTPPPVKHCALAHGIPVYQPERLAQSEELVALLQLPIDLIVTAAFGQFLPQNLLDYPTYGAVNVHASLLPKYRGGAPVHYAIMNGERETGITLMRMVKKMDAGNILAQASLPITSDDTVSTLFPALSQLGANLLLQQLPLLFAGELVEIPQDEAKVTYSPNISREQEQIDWQQNASTIDCHIRGMNAWPGAYTLYHGERFKLWRAKPLADYQHHAPTGTILSLQDKRLIVACGEGTALELLEVQPAGKGAQTVAAFLSGSGQRMREGEQFDGK